MASILGKVGLSNHQNTQQRNPPRVKYTKSEILSRVYKIPELKFEDQDLTSFASLAIFQSLMMALEMKSPTLFLISAFAAFTNLCA